MPRRKPRLKEKRWNAKLRVTKGGRKGRAEQMRSGKSMDSSRRTTLTPDLMPKPYEGQQTVQFDVLCSLFLIPVYAHKATRTLFLNVHSGHYSHYSDLITYQSKTTCNSKITYPQIYFDSK